MADAPYIHGTEAEEQRRLADLNALINAHALAALDPGPGESLVDFGSGLGQFTREVARCTRARALGLERSPEQIARARALAAAAGEEHLAEFRPSEAESPDWSPGEPGTFHIAHARFLLEHVSDPLAVVRAMAAAVRPGGRVVLEDDDHDVLRLWPEPPGFAAVWRAYQATYRRIGRDPAVGRRLVELLAHAGLAPRRSALLPFGACAGEPAFARLVRNLADILRGAASAIVATGETSAAELDAVLSSLDDFERRDDAVLWYSICWAEGVRP